MTKHLSSSSSFRTSTTPLCAVHPQQQRHDNINDENVENTDTKELLSVAPMMGHTNRHYRYYYRLLSKRTYLYTEMMPTSKSLPYEVLTLHQLLATSCIQESPVVLQLGGNDPTTLGQSHQRQSQSQHSQSHYIAINLNCGCPSNAVGGRAGGCALMTTPELVLECQSSQSILSKPPPPPTITVKHRLGIRDALSYNATFDRLQNDDEAFNDVSSFIRIVSSNDSVSTFHVHARLGILEKARRRSRRSTIKNRDVPPLRPNVIYKLTTEFPHLDFVSNGGITNMREVVKEVTGNGDGSVMGAMVGRTIINHPCSFAAADRLLW
ncbi:FMN-linked oxidoreductase, partial [Fragilariopsis cylindrus CCMP1102]